MLVLACHGIRMACSLQHDNDDTLVAETPGMYASASMTRFIEQEVVRPSKQWIASIIDGRQEKEDVIFRSEEFVLLPDTERVNRYWRISSGSNIHCNSKQSGARSHTLARVNMRHHHRKSLAAVVVVRDSSGLPAIDGPLA